MAWENIHNVIMRIQDTKVSKQSQLFKCTGKGLEENIRPVL